MSADSELRDGVLTVRDHFVPNVRQSEFFNLCNDLVAEQIMFSGSIRGGKTQSCAKRIVADAWKYGGPGWKAGVFRRTYRELEDSTKGVFIRGDGGLPPALPQALYDPRDYRVVDNMITLRNGAEILFRSLENPKEAAEKIRNVTYGAMFIDQIEELDSDEYELLYDTMVSRLSDPRGPGKMYLAANPGRTSHFAYKRFHPESEERLPETAYVHVTLHDNKQYLDPKYYARMLRQKTRNPEWYDRFIEGKWGAFGGKRFKNFRVDEPWVIEPFAIPKHWEIIEAIDYGFRAPTVCTSMAIDPFGLHYIVAEHAEAEKPVSHHAAAIKQIRDEHNIPPSVTYLDPSAWAQAREFQSVAMEFSDYGIDCAKAQNDRLGGWNRIDEFLTTMIPDPYQEGVPFEERRLVPRLRFFAGRCPLLMKELPNLVLKDGSDDVEKKEDHASDTLRYLLMSREPPPLVDDSVQPDIDRRTEYAQRRIREATSADRAALLLG